MKTDTTPPAGPWRYELQLWSTTFGGWVVSDTRPRAAGSTPDEVARAAALWHSYSAPTTYRDVRFRVLVWHADTVPFTDATALVIWPPPDPVPPARPTLADLTGRAVAPVRRFVEQAVAIIGAHRAVSALAVAGVLALVLWTEWRSR